MSAMYPATPPVTDLSRPKLKQLASWIRDDLDPVIAQEGPEVLRPDDVLMLHDVFTSLRHSGVVSALDLRATGIHRAIMEVAGTATRWPGRLADECDKIIHIWTSKFGRLDELHPFMYGRGGRLEGIASAEETSKASLLKRWQFTCPDKLMPKRSRRHGDLGFRPGAWWLNPLFAHHAGIIDLETTEGGICADQYGAYAVLLKDTSEIDATSETEFTYRPGQMDRGRYCLTAANARSRHPIRVLRSHSLNSTWGPKAGIRYEGLYKASGWVIRSVKPKESVEEDHKIGDLMYEIKFERVDEVPMQEVLKHPTSAEVDDYAEYKRLRRFQREGAKIPRGISQSDLDRMELPPPAKAAPPIVPVALSFNQSKDPPKPSPTPSRSTTFKFPIATVAASLLPSRRSPSPTKDKRIRELSARPGSPRRNILEAPAKSILRSNTYFGKDEHDPPANEPSPSHLSVLESRSSDRSNFRQSVGIKEVAPWVDLDLETVVSFPGIDTRPGVPEGITTSLSQNESSTLPERPSLASAQGTNSRTTTGSNAENRPDRPPNEKQKSIPIFSGLKAKKSQRTVQPISRSRNPLAKLFDGARESMSDHEPLTQEDFDYLGQEEDYFSHRISRTTSSSPHPARPMAERRQRSSSTDATMQPFSPRPWRPISPSSPLVISREDSICVPRPFGPGLIPALGLSDVVDISRQGTMLAEHKGRRYNGPQTSIPKLQSLPVALHDLMTRPSTASPSVSPTISASASHLGTPQLGERSYSSESVAALALKQYISGVRSSTDKERPQFIDPFQEKRKQKHHSRTKSVEKLAPNAVA